MFLCAVKASCQILCINWNIDVATYNFWGKVAKLIIFALQTAAYPTEESWRYGCQQGEFHKLLVKIVTFVLTCWDWILVTLV